MLRHALRVIERARAADVVLGEMREFGLERGIRLGVLIGLLEFENERHEGLGEESAAENAEMSRLVGSGAEGIELVVHE